MMRGLPFLVGALALALLLGFRVSDPRPVQQIRLWVFDTYQRLQPRPYEPAGVRIVDIDEASIERFGQWPWSRAKIAQIVEALTGMGAAAIAFDVVFAERDRTAPEELRARWPGGAPGPEAEAVLAALPDPDLALAEVLRRTPSITGFAPSNGVAERMPARPAGFAFAGPEPVAALQGFTGASVNLAKFEGVAPGNGSFAIRNDLDSILRRVPVYQNVAGVVYPTLVAETLRVGQGARTHLIRSAEDGAGGVAMVAAKIGAIEFPTTAAGEVILHDTGHVPDRYVPAWQVLDPASRAEVAPRIAGHLVLIGTSATGLLDLRSTPLSPVVPGVSLHAQALEQIILGRHLTRPDWATGLETVALLGLGILLVTLLPFAGAAGTAALGFVAAAAAVGGSWYAFTRHGMLFDPVYPLMAALAVYVPTSALMFIRTENEKRFVRSAFGRYLSPALVERLAENPKALNLGGEDRELTILFSDVRGFTSLSETMTPEQLIRFMNEYFTPMSDSILEREGFIDKYIGDAIMAFWNAPLDVADHAAKGCAAALAMRADLARLNEGWRTAFAAEGRPFREMRIGIGLHTGVCRVGNMGSTQRLNYSALGDDVNVTSRIEGQTKDYGVDVLITEATRAAAGPDFATLELDRIRVKGRAQPVNVHALLGREEELAFPTVAAFRRAHEEMLAAYRAQDWAAAEARLAEAREALEAARSHLAPTLDLGYVLGTYAGRIAALRLAPPTPGWDLVYPPQPAAVAAAAE